MTYCHKRDGHDVTLTETLDGMIMCLQCLISRPDPDFAYRSEAIDHLELHQMAGHKVPDTALIMLRNQLKRWGDHSHIHEVIV